MSAMSAVTCCEMLVFTAGDNDAEFTDCLTFQLEIAMAWSMRCLHVMHVFLQLRRNSRRCPANLSVLGILEYLPLDATTQTPAEHTTLCSVWHIACAFGSWTCLRPLCLSHERCWLAMRVHGGHLEFSLLQSPKPQNPWPLS